MINTQMHMKYWRMSGFAENVESFIERDKIREKDVAALNSFRCFFFATKTVIKTNTRSRFVASHTLVPIIAPELESCVFACFQVCEWVSVCGHVWVHSNETCFIDLFIACFSLMCILLELLFYLTINATITSFKVQATKSKMWYCSLHTNRFHSHPYFTTHTYARTHTERTKIENLMKMKSLSVGVDGNLRSFFSAFIAEKFWFQTHTHTNFNGKSTLNLRIESDETWRQMKRIFTCGRFEWMQCIDTVYRVIVFKMNEFSASKAMQCDFVSYLLTWIVWSAAAAATDVMCTNAETDKRRRRRGRRIWLM